MNDKITLGGRPVGATPNSGSEADHPINGIHQDQKTVPASLELNKIDSFCEEDSARFRNLLEKALCKTDEIIRTDSRIWDDPTDMDAIYKRKWLRPEDEKVWRSARTCRAAQIHDNLLLRAVVADDVLMAALNTSTEAESALAAKEAWALVDKAREMLGLDNYIPPCFIGQLRPDSTGALARAGISEVSRIVSRCSSDNHSHGSSPSGEDNKESTF